MPLTLPSGPQPERPAPSSPTIPTTLHPASPVNATANTGSNYFSVLMTAIKVVAAFSTFVFFIILLATRDEDVRFYCGLSLLVLLISWIIDPDFGPVPPSLSSPTPTPRAGGFDLQTLLSPPIPPQVNPRVIGPAVPLAVPTQTPSRQLTPQYGPQFNPLLRRQTSRPSPLRTAQFRPSDALQQPRSAFTLNTERAFNEADIPGHELERAELGRSEFGRSIFSARTDAIPIAPVQRASDETAALETSHVRTVLGERSAEPPMPQADTTTRAALGAARASTLRQPDENRAEVNDGEGSDPTQRALLGQKAPDPEQRSALGSRTE